MAPPPRRMLATQPELPPRPQRRAEADPRGPRPPRIRHGQVANPYAKPLGAKRRQLQLRRAGIALRREAAQLHHTAEEAERPHAARRARSLARQDAQRRVSLRQIRLWTREEAALPGVRLPPRLQLAPARARHRAGPKLPQLDARNYLGGTPSAPSCLCRRRGTPAHRTARLSPTRPTTTKT